MKTEVFSASISDGSVKVLGMKVDCGLKDLSIKVNGVDITQNLVLENVEISFEKKLTGTD